MKVKAELGIAIDALAYLPLDQILRAPLPSHSIT